MFTLPAATPVTSPVVLTVAIVGSVALHVPPAAPSVSVVVTPAQIVVVPVIAPADGSAFTVFIIVAVLLQPVLPSVIVYPIVAVPAAMPVTTPPATVAVPGALLLQVPPVAASVSVVVEPAHSLAVPVIGATAGPASVVHVTELAAVQPAMLVTL